MSDRAAHWTITATKTGYTPVMWELEYSYSAQVITAIEGSTPTNGQLVLDGYAVTKDGTTISDAPIRARILWVKNS